MERLNCVVLEDNILEFLDEIEKQMNQKIICCKCKNPCEDNTRCRIAMKNLLTDINIFKNAYLERNKVTEDDITLTQVDNKEQELEEKVEEVKKQVLND